MSVFHLQTKLKFCAKQYFDMELASLLQHKNYMFVNFNVQMYIVFSLFQSNADILLIPLYALSQLVSQSNIFPVEDLIYLFEKPYNIPTYIH